MQIQCKEMAFRNAVYIIILYFYMVVKISFRKCVFWKLRYVWFLKSKSVKTGKYFWVQFWVMIDPYVKTIKFETGFVWNGLKTAVRWTEIVGFWNNKYHFLNVVSKNFLKKW